MRNILFILAVLMGFGAFGQTNIPTRQMLVDTNGVVKWPTNITSITIGGQTYTNLTGFGLTLTNSQLSVDTTQLPAGSGGDGLITSVAEDFDVSAGELNLTNALGTGPLVRQSAASGVGTVTSVGLALPSILSVSGTPVTGSGTLTGTLATQAANRIFAGPTTGADATPTFRALVDADVPNDITVDLAATATVANSGDSATSFFSTGEIEDARLPAGLARDSEVAAGYQPLDPDLTTLATLNGSALTNLNGTEIRSGTVAAARIDSSMATDAEVTAATTEAALEAILDLQDMQGAVTDGQVPNNITVDNATTAATANAGDSATAFFSSGTVEDARIDAALARDSEVSSTYAPLASPALTGSPTVGGTNLMDYAATHLTEAEASALYQSTNAILTTVANSTGGTSTNFLAGDGTHKQVTTNMVPGLNAILATIGGGSGEVNTATNLATQSSTVQGLYDSKSGVDLRFRSIQAGSGITLTSNATTLAIASSGGSPDGTTNSAMTITNLTVQKINGAWHVTQPNGGLWADGGDNGENTDTFFRPYLIDQLASATIGAPSSASTNNVGYAQRWTSSSSANSGNTIYINATEVLSVGSYAVTVATFLNTNAAIGRFGFHDHASTGGGSEVVRIDVENGYFFGTTKDNTTTSTTTTSNQVTLNIPYWIEAGVEATNKAVFRVYNLQTKALVWSDELSSNIPLDQSRTTQQRSTFYHTGSAVTNLLILDAIGRINTKTRL